MENKFIFMPWECGYGLGEYLPPPIASKSYFNYSTEDLEKALLLKEGLTHNRDNQRDAVLNLPYLHFMMLADLLSVSGQLIEDYFCKGEEKISSKLDSGDIKCKSGSAQFKASMISYSKKSAGFKRIQIWQDVSEYRFVIINKSNYYLPSFFTLTFSQMKKELKTLNASDQNGTKEANKKNKNRYLSMALNCDKENEHFQRWKNDYFKEDITRDFISKIDFSNTIKI